MTSSRLRFIPLALTLILALTLAYGGDQRPVTPSQKDKCPVCGMFVAKYRDFLAEIVFKDGTYVVFDGTKDMVKYFLNPGKYGAQKQAEDIDTIYVTDYYKLALIDGLRAYYVAGSDIYGPMGRELIPLEKEEDAIGFMRDHKGKAILKFNTITHDTI